MPALSMTHWERIDAAIAGGPVDHVPISLWRHFPEIDLDAAKFAEATVNWQRSFDFDLVKFMPSGTYGVEDWGAKSAWLNTPIGARTVVTPGVTDAAQWPRLPRLSPTAGMLGEQNAALIRTAEALKGEVPILQTLFGPLTLAYKLAGPRVVEHLRQHPDLFEAGLEIIADTMLAFASLALRSGAHGIFFSTQCASRRFITEAEHLRFGTAYDKRVLDGIAGEARYIMLHLHGEELMFDQLLTYPGNMVNWHDRRSEVSLAAMASRFKGLLVGGLDEETTLPNGPEAAIAAEVRDAIAQTGGRRLMIAPGCVVPIATPEAHYRAAIEATRRG